MAELAFLKDIGLIIIAATVLAILSGKLKQPLILGYVLAGIMVVPFIGFFRELVLNSGLVPEPIRLLIGPLTLISDPEPIQILSELGIAFLLFIVGLELDFKRIAQVGIKSSAIGVVQVILTAAAGYGIGLLLGFGKMESLYIGLVISFSSTMIVAKLLGEQKELDSVHGELVLVVLIIQDILAVIALSLLVGGGSVELVAMPSIIFNGLLLVGIAYVVYKFALPAFLKEAVQSTELIFISALTTMFFFSAVATYLGYSFAIGGFIAGVALSTTKYSHEITGRIKPLKDFFLVLFFVTLGMQMVFKDFAQILIPLAVLLLAVLLLKPLLIFLIAKQFRYSNRTAFFAGAQLGQVGEFSLVLAAQGMVFHHITQSMFSMLISLTIITMVLTAYMIKYDDSLYNNFFARLLRPFDRRKIKEQSEIKEQLSNHIIIFGLHRMTEKIISGLMGSGQKFVVVDHNPEKAKNLAERKINYVCSDMTNLEVYEILNIPKARVIISTVHNLAANIGVIRKVKRLNSKAIVMVASNNEEEALRLYDAGADFVIIPQILGGQKVVDYLTHLKPSQIKKWGKKYYKELRSL